MIIDFKKAHSATIGRVYEKGKRYNINSHDENYDKEDPKGTLCPSRTYCYVNYFQKYFDNDTSKEANLRRGECFHGDTPEDVLQQAREFADKINNK